MGIPDEAARLDILKVLCAGIKLSEKTDLKKIARLTPGYVGADLLSLLREAAMLAITRAFDNIDQETERKNLKRKIKMPDHPTAAKLPNNGELEVKEVVLEKNEDVIVEKKEEVNGEKMSEVADPEVDVVGLEPTDSGSVRFFF